MEGLEGAGVEPDGPAAELADLPQEAVGMAKLVIDASVDIDRNNQRQLERIANTTLVKTDACRRSRAPFLPR